MKSIINKEAKRLKHNFSSQAAPVVQKPFSGTGIFGIEIKSVKAILLGVMIMLCNLTATADLLIVSQPGSITTCQPNVNTDFTTSFTVGRGPGCGNLSSVGNVTFIWEYFNGSAWVAVANNTPAGFTYSNLSIRTGTGSGAEITNTLTITLSASATTGIFNFRCRANQPTGCSNFVTSNTINVTVNAKPAPSFITEPGNNACINTPVTYTTQSGQSGYTWNIPGVAGVHYNITGGSVSSNTVTLVWLTTGNYTLTVNYTNSNGCTAATPTPSTSTTVNNVPAPTFTLQPSGNICVSAGVTYTTEAGQSNYLWNVPGILNTDYIIVSGGTGAGDNTVTLQWLTPGNKVVTINYNNAAGCAAVTSTVSNNITVVANPTPSFATFPPADICEGTDVTYTTQAAQSNYSWSITGVLNTDYTITSGGLGTGSNTVTLQWLTGGSKTVTVNYTDGNGCTGIAAASATSTVNIPVVPTITPASSTTFCSGDSVVLTSSPAVSYEWYSNSIIIPGAVADNYIATITATYSVKITDAVGCTAVSGNTTVTVNPLPSITAATQAASLCYNIAAQTTTVDYSATTNNPITYSITWDAVATTAGFTDVLNAAIPASPIPVSVPAAVTDGTYTGTITVTNGNNCTSTGNLFTVEIKALPDVSDFNTTATDGCEGGTSVITISSSTLVNGNYTISYDLSGANNSTGNTAAITFSGGAGTFTTAALYQGVTNITITQVAAFTCTSNTVAGNTAGFTINPLPPVDPITGAGNVCIGNTIVLSNATAGGVWSSNNNLVATINSSGLVTGVSGGTVDIIYTTAPVNGCFNIVTKNISVDALPPSTPITGTTTICNNTSTTISNVNAGGTWFSNNSSVATINSAGTITALSTGTTSITYIFPVNANGCTDSVFAVVTVDPAPVADAGANSTVCQSSSPTAVILSGASVGGAASTGAWSIISGGGTLSNTSQTSNPSVVTYTPAANFSGTVNLLLTTNTPGSCTAATSTKTITVTPLPTVNAGAAVTLCQSTSPSAITLSGSSVEGGATSGAWSIISGGGSLSSTAQSASPATITYTPAVNFTGTVTLRLTTDIPAGCTAATSDKIITILTAPVVNAGTPIVTCADPAQTASGSATVNITAGATAANHVSVIWSSSGTGTFTNPSSLTTATYTPSAADRAAGMVTLTLTAIGNSPCGNVTATKTLTVTPAINEADANNWGGAPNCNGVGVQFSLQTPPAGGNGSFTYQWMEKNNCGSSGTSNPVPGATGMSFIPATNNCFWLQISSGGCRVPQILVSTTTRRRPHADTAALANITFGVGGTNPQICIGSSTTLTAQSGVSYTYTWSPSTGLSTTTGATVVANPTATTTYLITATATDGTGCTRTVNNTITVNPLTVAGSVPASAVACNSGSAAINVTGNTGNVTRWESSTDGGVTWSPIANTSTTLNYTIAATTTLYRALVQSGACAAIFTNATQTGLHNVWQGKTNSDWHTATNWSDQALPSLACPSVTIPAATPFAPLLNAGVATINSLVIDAAASLTISNNAKMQLAGSVTNNGTFDVTDGTLEFNGAAAQGISGNDFVLNTVRNVILSNANGLAVNNGAGNLLNIKEAFAFGNVNNATLVTNDNLVLLSSAAGTARIADITNDNSNAGNSINGKVTIQRFIPGRRAWRLLTAPVTASSLVKISDSWQEGAPRVTNPAVINATNNPNPGYGTHVTYGNPATNGYDQGINGNASIFYLTPAGWNGVPTATNNGSTVNSGYITDQPGFMVFVRGDRGTQLSQAIYAATSPTVLRIKGNINTGQLTIPIQPGLVFGGSHFRVIGNPYPSAINFKKIISNAANSGAGFADAFYLWEPSVTGSNGVGGWVALSYNNFSGTYDRTVLLGGSTTIDNSGDIQSGSAFIIDYAGIAASIGIEETNKASGSNNNPFRPMYQQNQVRINLLAKNADNTVSVNDGVLITYHDSYNSDIDKADMWKLLNFAENISIVKDTASLVLEKRKTFEWTDTIQLQLAKMRQKNYRLQIQLDALHAPDGTIAVLEDKVLNAETIIDSKATSEYDFSVNAGNISATDRFRLIFKPVTVFAGLSAYQQGDNAVLGWTLLHEFNVNRFEIERSTDGVSFVKVGVTSSKGNSDKLSVYNWMDVKPGTGEWYYRIKAVSNNNITIYSNVITVLMINNKQELTVYPNPVTGNIIYIRLNTTKKGFYNTKLFSTNGQLIISKNIFYTGAINNFTIDSPRELINGNYLLQVTGPGGIVTSVDVFVQRK